MKYLVQKKCWHWIKYVARIVYNEPVAVWSSFVCKSSKPKYLWKLRTTLKKSPERFWLNYVNKYGKIYVSRSSSSSCIMNRSANLVLFFSTLRKQTTAFGLPKWHNPSRDGSTSSVWTIGFFVGGRFLECSSWKTRKTYLF